MAGNLLFVATRAYVTVRPSTDDAPVVIYDASIDSAVIEEVARQVTWVHFLPVSDFASYAGSPALAVASGPGLFLLDAIEAAVPVVVPGGEESRRYVRDGAGFLTGGDADSIAEGVRRIVAMAPAARRVMGRIGRNHLLQLVG